METKDEKFEEILAALSKKSPELQKEMANMDYLIMDDGRIIWSDPDA